MKKIIILLLIVLMALSAYYVFFKYLPKKQATEEFLEMLGKYKEEKIRTFEEENKEYEDYEVDIAFLGDSLTDGYNVSEYFKGYVVANRGISADTTFDLEDRLKTSVYDLKPKVIVMLIGTNNPDTMFDNYENILLGFKENLPDTKIVLVSIPPVGEGFKDRNQLIALNNVKIKLLAEKYGHSYVDIYSSLLNTKTDKMHSDYTTDNVHFTAAGYEVITTKLTPVLNELLPLE